MIRLKNIEIKDIINYNQIFVDADKFYEGREYRALKYYDKDSINFIFSTNDRYLLYQINNDTIRSSYFTAYENKIIYFHNQDYCVNLLGNNPSFLDNNGVIHYIYKLDGGFIYRQQIKDKILNLAFSGNDYHTKAKPTNIEITENNEEFHYVKINNRPFYYTNYLIDLISYPETYHEKDVFDKLKKKGFNIYVPEFILNFFENDINNVIKYYEEVISSINGLIDRVNELERGR